MQISKTDIHSLSDKISFQKQKDDTTFLQSKAKIDSLISSIHLDPSNLDDFYEQASFIYHSTMDMSNIEFDYFCSIFPYQLFISIAMQNSDPDLQSICLILISNCIESTHFPLSLFNNQIIIEFLVLCLTNQGDHRLNKASITILTKIISKYPEIRNFIIARDFPRNLFLSPPEEVSYFLQKFCSASPPLPAQILTQVAEITFRFLNGPPYFPETPILEGALILDERKKQLKQKNEELVSSSSLLVMEPALSTVLAIIENHIPEEREIIRQLVIELFLPLLPQYILSGAPYLIEKSLQILLWCDDPPVEFVEILASASNDQFSERILKLIGQNFAKFSEPGRAWCSYSPAIYNLADSIIGRNTFQVDLVFLKVMIVTHPSVFNKKLFSLSVQFLSTPDAVPFCFPFIIETLEQKLNEEDSAFVDNTISQNSDFIEEIFENNEIAASFAEKYHLLTEE